MKLSPEESRILRRELPAVRALIDKGLITGSGILTAAGQKWIDEVYPALLKAARSKGGEAGGTARAKLPRPRLVQIANMGNEAKAMKARARKRKAAAREKEA